MFKRLLFLVILFLLFSETVWAQIESTNYLGYYNGARLDSITTENGGSVYGVESNCTEDDQSTWGWLHSICDRNDSVNTQNSTTQAYAPDEDAGTTWSISGDPNIKGVMTIDLGQERTYNELRVFQMVDSDGWVTHVQMFENASNPEVWTSIFSETEVSAGSGYYVEGGLPSDYIVEDPTVITFPETTSRYVQLKFRNDGSSDHDNYIEVFSVKLFNGEPYVVPEFSNLSYALAVIALFILVEIVVIQGPKWRAES